MAIIMFFYCEYIYKHLNPVHLLASEINWIPVMTTSQSCVYLC